MVEQKENIGFRIIEAFFAVIFVLLAFSYLNGRLNNSLNTTKHNISKGLTLSQENAVISTETHVVQVINQEFSKIRFPEEKLSSILTTESRKNDLSVILQKNKISVKPVNHAFVYYRHNFPREKDELPLAG